MKMKILYLNNADYKTMNAGKEQVLKMTRAFRKNKAETKLVTFGLDKKTNPKHGKLQYSLRTIILLTKAKKGEQDVVMTRDLLLAILTKRKLKDRAIVIYELHNVHKKRSWEYLIKTAAKEIDMIVTISQGLTDYLKKNFEVKCKIITLPCAAEEPEKEMKKEKARRNLKLQKDAKIVIYTGALKEDRDIQTLIRTAKHTPDTKYLLFGNPTEWIKSKTKGSKNIKIMGYAKNPYTTYCAADVLFAGYSKNTNTYEYMSPIKLFEYGWSKRPMIITDLKRTREFYNEKEAWFYNEGDEKQLADTIRNAIEKKEKSRQKAENAYKRNKERTYKNRAKHIMTLAKSIQKTQSKRRTK